MICELRKNAPKVARRFECLIWAKRTARGARSTIHYQAIAGTVPFIAVKLRDARSIILERELFVHDKGASSRRLGFATGNSNSPHCTAVFSRTRSRDMCPAVNRNCSAARRRVVSASADSQSFTSYPSDRRDEPTRCRHDSATNVSRESFLSLTCLVDPPVALPPTR